MPLSRRRRRLWLALALAVVLGTAAASWYLASRDGTAEPEEVPSAVGLEAPSSDVEVELPRQTGVAPFYGLKTTVPDTLGYSEKTAAFALEEGGFRVRVMTRKVSDSSEEGLVLQQLPRGGVTRRVNWIVTIVVGRLR